MLMDIMYYCIWPVRKFSQAISVYFIIFTYWGLFSTLLYIYFFHRVFNPQRLYALSCVLFLFILLEPNKGCVLRMPPYPKSPLWSFCSSLVTRTEGNYSETCMNLSQRGSEIKKCYPLEPFNFFLLSLKK